MSLIDLIIANLQAINGLTITGDRTINKITEIYCSVGGRIYCLRFKIFRNELRYQVDEFIPSSSTNNSPMSKRIKRIMNECGGTMRNLI
jgi:hypothetical protein